MLRITDRRLSIAAVAVFCIGGGSMAHAQKASDWTGEAHAAARLIAGGVVKSGDTTELRAGIEIKLDPGWKTYWRYPGDSGVPPTFDFSGSENVKSVTTLWPAPERFSDGGGGHSIGYVGDVVLPLRIIPRDAHKLSVLHVRLGYAVCGNLCVPAQANLDLTLSGKVGDKEPALEAAEARVPHPIPLGATDQRGGLAVRSVHRETEDGHARVVVDVVVPEGVPIELFAEGPTPDWALPLPEPQPQAAGSALDVRRFVFDLDGLPPGAKADGATLTFTEVAPSDAIEVKAHLD